MNPAQGGRSRQCALVLTLWIGFLPVVFRAHPVQGTQLVSAMFIHLGNGNEFPRPTSPQTGVRFDIDGSGTLDQVAWTEPNSEVALLALDVNGDGRITSGKELFGSHMVPEAGNGPNALLHIFGASGAAPSGAVHQGHQLYEQILLWGDRNHNGVSESSELRLAKELFTQIGMGFVRQQGRDEHGNRATYKGWAELRTGGPAQGPSTDPHDHQARLRHYYEVVLAHRVG